MQIDDGPFGIALDVIADQDNFDDGAYLAANPDVRAAINEGRVKDCRAHFDSFGRAEQRRVRLSHKINPAREKKVETIKSILISTMPHSTAEGKFNFLTPELIAETKIAPTTNISSNHYDTNAEAIIAKYRHGLVLDCGAGRRDIYYPNVVNFEIVDYDTTDVLGVGEHLPFLDSSFDAVLSIAVLEHVRDPFKCAQEICRVLRPGGELYCSVPFLQPLHGYPHHYFNATPQGLRRLFEDRLTVTAVDVLDSTHPIWALKWILESWSNSLPPAAREELLTMPVRNLLRPPFEQLVLPYCKMMPLDTKFELACGTVLSAFKPR